MGINNWLYRALKPLDQLKTSLSGGTMLNVGDEAPDFTVKTHEGKTVSLKDYRGKNVVLWFYPKADTPGCTMEGCGLRDRNDHFKEKNAVLLGVSFDTVTENKAFAEKFGFQYPLLCDTERDLGMKYGACKTTKDSHAARIAYIIDTSGKIRQAFPKVDASTFPQTALAAL